MFQYSNRRTLFSLVAITLLLTSPGCLEEQPEAIIPHEWLDISLDISVANETDNWSITLPIPQYMENGQQTSKPAESSILLAASSDYLSIEGDENESWIVVSGNGSQLLTISGDAEVESGHHEGGRKFSLIVDPRKGEFEINASFNEDTEILLTWKHRWISNSLCTTKVNNMVTYDEEYGQVNPLPIILKPNENKVFIYAHHYDCSM